MTTERINKLKNDKQATLEISTKNRPKHNRRKLLKGAVALPVVMTLHSGAALARTSNITGEADSIADAVFKDTINGPQLLCVFYQSQLPEGAYDLGHNPQAALVTNPPIDLLNDDAATQLSKKMEQWEICRQNNGIIISAAAYTSIMAKSGINISLTL